MAIPHSVRRGVLAALLVLAFVLQGTISVLAGTTGAINGTVIDPQSNQPVSGASVTATSPSQSATTTSDATGRFHFISLVPDTYTITAQATTARDAVSVNGITVQADQTQTVNLAQPAKLRQIGSVTSRAAASLVKPGTTADVYSINAVTQDKASPVGGGGNLNSAWSAIASVPGVYVAPNQAGYIGAGPQLSIRGGDYDQIGYEMDGVPLNRSFDQYPSGPLSSLGQQEVQVYTGAPAANAESNSLSGYINQVIRTGTAPPSRNLTLAAGTPVFYNKVAFEAGGANPARTFSYYLGAGAYNQGFRYVDQFNGAGISQTWGIPLNPCPGNVTPAQVPSCFNAAGQPFVSRNQNNAVSSAWALGPITVGQQASLEDRDTILNMHFGIPRKDGNKDDVQVLFDNNFIHSPFYMSTNDQGGAAYLNTIGFGTPFWTDGFQFLGQPVGTLLPRTFTGGGVTQYFFPSSPTGRPFQSDLPADLRDAFDNNQSILKLQYQRNFGTNAFLRVYGYTYYSDWLNNAPQGTLANNVGPVSPDYELSSHTRGLSATFADQINPQHLLTLQGQYTTAGVIRANNTEMINGLFGPNTINNRTVFGALVDSSNPTNGICYSQAHVPVNCFNAAGTNLNRGNNGFFSLQQAFNGAVPMATGTCGGGPCQYLVVGNGQQATFNSVVPRFSAISLTDHFTPNAKLSVDLGLRMDIFAFQGGDTTNGGAARTFFFNAFNNQFPGSNIQNVSAQYQTYSELEPRVGATYTLDPRTVLRASYGRYAQAPNSAFEQYNTLQADALSLYQSFVPFGFRTPAHPVRPSIANNFDASVEHQFRGDLAVKLTPFYRQTKDQLQNFFLDQKTGFISGLNVGTQTASGVELEIDKGDFSRNGLSGRLTFGYTNSTIKYTRFSNGGSIIDSFNADIAAYNAFTKGGGGAPCYTQATAAAAGAPAPGCGAGTVANPYFNAPTQPLMDPNASYAPYDLFPSGIGGGGYTSYVWPYVATTIVQYKHGPLAVTPALQLFWGAKYGVPETMPGIDPTSCTGLLANNPNADPRYQFGAVGGGAYDASGCAGQLAIPNFFTGKFDNLGAFTQPTQLLLHMQVTYDVNKRLTLVGNFANIINRCWGGSNVPWAVNHACIYSNPILVNSGSSLNGNFFNPGDALQPIGTLPYQPTGASGIGFPAFPFNMFFEARLKI